jgi:hypothetical protein
MLYVLLKVTVSVAVLSIYSSDISNMLLPYDSANIDYVKTLNESLHSCRTHESFYQGRRNLLDIVCHPRLLSPEM